MSAMLLSNLGIITFFWFTLRIFLISIHSMDGECSSGHIVTSSYCRNVKLNYPRHICYHFVWMTSFAVGQPLVEHVHVGLAIRLYTAPLNLKNSHPLNKGMNEKQRMSKGADFAPEARAPLLGLEG